jgi:hypothetical protein
MPFCGGLIRWYRRALKTRYTVNPLKSSTYSCMFIQVARTLLGNRILIGMVILIVKYYWTIGQILVYQRLKIILKYRLQSAGMARTIDLWPQRGR